MIRSHTGPGDPRPGARSRRPLRMLASLTLGTATLAIPLAVQAAATAPAGATVKPSVAKTTTLSLSDDAASVKTSNGTSWYLLADYDGLAAPKEVELGIERISGKGVELHLWDMTTSSPDFSFSTSSKTGTLKQSNAIDSVDLTFKGTSSKKQTCTSGSETIYTGTLTGTASLTTGLSGGGTVKGTSWTADGAKPEVTVDDDCAMSLGNLCGGDVLFAAQGTNDVAGGQLSFLGTNEDSVGVERYATLSEGTRTDIGALEGAKVTYKSSAKELTISAASSGIVTGSATLKGGKYKKTSNSCSYKSTKYKDTTVSLTGGTYSSPSGKTITAHLSIGGNLVGPTSTKETYAYITTAKKV